MASKDKENVRPVYTNSDRINKKGNRELFDSISEATDFWKELWGKDST